MRKNLLIATLAGLCVIGVTACSKGDEPKTDDTTTQQTITTTTPGSDQNQATGQTSDNSSLNTPIASPAQPDAKQVVADTTTSVQTQNPDTGVSTGMTTDSSGNTTTTTTAPAVTPDASSTTSTTTTDNNTGTSTTQNTTTTPATDTTTTTTTQPQ
jgi:hypothetical protein